MGRWSRLVAKSFLDWLSPIPGSNWLELGCGTGALTEVICRHGEPASLVACDPSADFISRARESVLGCPAEFLVASADNLPQRVGGFNIVASGLVLNFLSEPGRAVNLMMDRASPDGVISAYVWDYADGMQFLRIFWDEAIALDWAAASLHEGRRFPLCQLDELSRLFREAGLRDVATTTITIPTTFAGFAEYWSPFLGKTGPAPSYVDSLDPEVRSELERRLRRRLEATLGGPILLTARALAVRGTLRGRSSMQ